MVGEITLSKSFEVFPTIGIIPKTEEIITTSVGLFEKFLREVGCKKKIIVTIQEDDGDIRRHCVSDKIITRETGWQIYKINEEGEIYIFYCSNTDLEREFWKNEIMTNINAKSLQGEVEKNMDIGYSWCIKKTMNQPPLICLYYGFLAIAIARLTKGIIHSTDGAWDYSRLPVRDIDFEKEYLNQSLLMDEILRNDVSNWVKSVL